MQILFITEVSPFPTNGGERMRCTGVLKALSELGHRITAIVNNYDEIDLNKYSISNVNFIEYNFQKRNTNNIQRVISNFSRDKDLLDLIEKIIITQSTDIVFIDYFFLGQYISYFHKKDIPVIYGTHNAQSILALQDISGNLLNKIKKSIWYVIYYFHERIFFPKTNSLIAVSKEDKIFYKKFINPDKITIIPNFIDFKEYNFDPSKKNYIIISGNFYSFQNKIGTIWFLKNIWKEQLSNKTELLLAGKGSKELLEDIIIEMDLKNIKATGEVDNIKPYIAGAKAAVVPLLQGSGTRLKCIEAMALKTQLISTTIGAEGIEHDGSILIAYNAEDFQKQILEVLDDQVDYTDKAYEICNNKYSLNAIKVPLDRLLNKLIQSE